MTKEKLIRYGKDYLHDLETACCPISDIHKEFVREAIKALEIVEEFEKAQIITGGRLNGRTYAYKCGLEDGKRKALEQQPSENWHDIPSEEMTLEQARQAVKDLRKKLVEQQPCEDCVSRASVKELFQEGCVMGMYDFLGIDDLPPVTPTHGTCKDCRWLNTDEDGNYYCIQTGCFDSLDFYCADYEAR